jgi:hypothetical protein
MIFQSDARFKSFNYRYGGSNKSIKPGKKLEITEATDGDYLVGMVSGEG